LKLFCASVGKEISFYNFVAVSRNSHTLAAKLVRILLNTNAKPHMIPG
jgi:hypothetical protein